MSRLGTWQLVSLGMLVGTCAGAAASMSLVLFAYSHRGADPAGVASGLSAGVWWGLTVYVLLAAVMGLTRRLLLVRAMLQAVR
jgi:hypothetical protein